MNSNAYIQNLEKWHRRVYLQGISGETDIENRLMDMGRGEERGEMHGESNIETYIAICKIDSQLAFAALLRKLKHRLHINLEGGMGQEMGGSFKRGGYMYTYG